MFKKRRVYRYKIYLTYAIIILFIGSLTYFVLFTNYFKIKDIKVISKTSNVFVNIDQAEVIRSIRHIYNRNLLFLSEHNLVDFIKTNFKYVEDADIQYNFPDKITILLNEKKVAGQLFQIDYENLNLTTSGEVLKENNKASVSSNLQIYVISKKIYTNYIIPESRYPEMFQKLEKIDEGEIFLDPQDIKFLETIQRSFDINGFKISKFLYFPIEKELHITLSNNLSIWFFATNIEEQFQKFQKSLTTIPNIENTAYIDARVNEKIIICIRGNICAENEHYKSFINQSVFDLYNKPTPIIN